MKDPLASLKKRSETAIQAALLKYLALVPGVTCWRMNTGAVLVTNTSGKRQPLRFGVTGMSDIIGWVEPNARWLAVEVKRPGAPPPTPAQVSFLERVRKAKGIAIVARSVDELREALRAHGVAAP